MNILRRIKNIGLTFLYPSLSTKNYKQEEYIDTWFQNALKNPRFEIVDINSANDIIEGKNHRIILNGEMIWVGNRYYASPSLMGIDSLPYNDTTILFFEKYDEYVLSIKNEFLEENYKVEPNDL